MGQLISLGANEMVWKRLQRHSRVVGDLAAPGKFLAGNLEKWGNNEATNLEILARTVLFIVVMLHTVYYWVLYHLCRVCTIVISSVINSSNPRSVHVVTSILYLLLPFQAFGKPLVAWNCADASASNAFAYRFM